MHIKKRYIYLLLLFCTPIGLIFLWLSDSFSLYLKKKLTSISIFLSIFISILSFVLIYNFLYKSSYDNNQSTLPIQYTENSTFIQESTLGSLHIKNKENTEPILYINSRRKLVTKNNLRTFMRQERSNYEKFNYILVDLNDGYAIYIDPHYSFMHYGKKNNYQLSKSLESYWVDIYSGNIELTKKAITDEDYKSFFF